MEHERRHAYWLSVGILLPLCFVQARALAQEADLPGAADLDALADLSLEELMNIQVTLLTGVEGTWFQTPAAMYVITGEDIRRSGHRTLAEALRLAPGMFVGHTDSSNWSVGMRGFNGSLANKTLILIDGRAVYDPLFGGTFWTIQDTLLEDVDRIEVIRGPGPTLWGSNAVNGVVNVTTKNARDTQGLYLEGGLGTYERTFGSIRYGFRVGESSWLRVYAKWLERDSFRDAAGNTTHDDWAMSRAGFRFDHGDDDDLTLTFQGDVYHSDRIGEHTPNAPVPGQSIVFVNDIRDVRVSGGNISLKIGREQEDHGWSLKTYYDRRQRVTDIQLNITRDTFDFDWRHHFKLGDSHEIMWGLGARHIHDQTEDGYQLLFDPNNKSLNTFSAFLQDTITLVPDHLYAMVGTKIEHNTYTDFEAQPSARLWWTPNDRSTLWASVSRAVRTPSRTEHDGSIVFGYIDTGVLGGGPPSGVIIPLGISGNSDIKAEELIAYEAGYRVRITDEFSLDIAGFYNDYERLIYVPDVLSPFNNDGTGESYGGEIAATWHPAENWTLQGSYSYVDVLIHGPVAPVDEGNTPRHMAKLQSQLDITKDIEWNAGLSYTSEVRSQAVGEYWRLDLGLTWRPADNIELSLWGQNLLDDYHKEYSTAEVPRGLYFMASFKF